MSAETMFKRAFVEELGTALKNLDPRWKALAGALGTYGAYKLLSKPVLSQIWKRMEGHYDLAETEKPIPIEKDEKGADLAWWIDRFKMEHPETKDVPVYVSGKVPVSQYVSELAFKVPGMKKTMEDEWGVTKPGIYLRELAAPVALHELGHVAIDRKIPGISLLTHGASILALAPLAAVLFRKPVATAGFVERYAPAIAAALEIPLLAEEAAASIIAERTLRREGKTGKDILVPAWLSYAVGLSTVPLATAGAAILKRL